MSSPLMMYNIRYYKDDGYLPETWAVQWVHNPDYTTSLVRRKDGQYARICSCQGFWRWRKCKHLTALTAFVEKQEAKQKGDDGNER